MRTGCFGLNDGTDSGGCGEVGEPVIYVLLDNVVEDGNSALVGCQVLS